MSALFSFLLIVQAMIALAMITVILMQRSEGGGLAGGGSPSGEMSARGASDFLTPIDRDPRDAVRHAVHRPRRARSQYGRAADDRFEPPAADAGRRHDPGGAEPDLDSGRDAAAGSAVRGSAGAGSACHARQSERSSAGAISAGPPAK